MSGSDPEVRLICDTAATLRSGAGMGFRRDPGRRGMRLAAHYGIFLERRRDEPATGVMTK